jgi:hypothetical protein
MKQLESWFNVANRHHQETTEFLHMGSDRRISDDDFMVPTGSVDDKTSVLSCS